MFELMEQYKLKSEKEKEEYLAANPRIKVFLREEIRELNSQLRKKSAVMKSVKEWKSENIFFCNSGYESPEPDIRPDERVVRDSDGFYWWVKSERGWVKEIVKYNINPEPVDVDAIYHGTVIYVSSEKGFSSPTVVEDEWSEEKKMEVAKQLYEEDGSGNPVMECGGILCVRGSGAISCRDSVWANTDYYSYIAAHDNEREDYYDAYPTYECDAYQIYPIEEEE